jgi:ribonuclease P/MRP protein subunit RPP1
LKTEWISLFIVRTLLLLVAALMHLKLSRTVGYTVIAFNQVIHRKIDPKTHVNELDSLLGLLRKRAGVIVLKRLTIVLDEDSEKGFGLVRPFAGYVTKNRLSIVF